MTNKLKYFIGNWKMFGDLSSLNIIYAINRFYMLSKYRKSFKIVMCIPNTLIYPFSKKLNSTLIEIGAQNAHFLKDYGPHTGSVNSSMLKKAGAKYVILGHSENRAEGENNAMIKNKVKAVLHERLNVILCIGETYKEKKNNKTLSVLKNQLLDSIDKKSNFKKIIIAYEPVWSIGTGKIPNSKDLSKIFKFIKSVLKINFKVDLFPPILYGGSVNPKNIGVFSSLSDLDGFLVGGASQSSKKFIDIMKNYYK